MLDSLSRPARDDMNQTRPPQHSPTARGTTPDDSPVPGHAAHPHPQRQPDAVSPHHHHGNPAAAATAAAALSQSPTSDITTTVSTTAPNARKRRASGAPGSRGVAHLTPDQLAKKRANDREAQRAIRERTRNTIETLEQRIRDLESQQPYQDLQRAIAERDKALAECDMLRKRLGLVAGIVGGAAAPPALHELASLTARQSPLPSVQNQQQLSPYHPQVSIPDQPQLHPALRSPHGHSRLSPSSHPAASVPVYYASDSAMRRWPAPLEQSPIPHMTSPNAYEQHRSSQLQHNNGERLGLNFLLDSNQSRKPSTPSSATLPFSSPSLLEQPLYSRLPNHSAPDCPLDALLNDFIHARRKQLQAGVPSTEVVGPDIPSLVAFHQRDSSHRLSCHPISALLIDILSKFPDIYALPEQVAVLYVMFLMLRWSIHPSDECYSLLPDWCKPTIEQLDRSHPIWYDHLPWPSMRRALITGPVQFEEFFVPYTTTLSINWPYSASQVLVVSPSAHPDDPLAVRMNPMFEAHLRDLRNWSLGSKFKQTFPHLVDENVRILDKPRP